MHVDLSEIFINISCFDIEASHSAEIIPKYQIEHLKSAFNESPSQNGYKAICNALRRCESENKIKSCTFNVDKLGAAHREPFYGILNGVLLE